MVDILARLHQEQVAALDRALADVIPPWCGGIDPTYWRTDIGMGLMREFFWLHSGEMISLANATRQVFGQATFLAKRRVKFLARKLYYRPRNLYPFDHRFSQRGLSKYYLMKEDIAPERLAKMPKGVFKLGWGKSKREEPG